CTRAYSVFLVAETTVLLSACRSIQLDNEDMEASFQEAVIETLGEFANNLPDYQKTEIMLFILSKVPHTPEGEAVASPTEGELQKTMLRSLLTVATKYSTVNLNQALPVGFLQSILRMSLAPDPNVRIVVQKILQTLLDRHDNLAKLEQVGFVPCVGDPLPNLSVEKCSRQDAVFMRKLGPEILYHMFAGILLKSNTYDNFVSIYITMALIVIELGSEDLLTEVFRIMFALQDEMQKEPTENSVYVHRFIASYLYLASSLTSIPAMMTHVNEVISARAEECPWLLPGPAPTSHPNSPSSLQLADKYLFNMKSIGEALHSSGHDTSKLFQPYTAPAAPSTGAAVQRSMLASSASTTFANISAKTATDNSQNSASFDLGSIDSSPGTVKKFVDLEDVSVKAFKSMLDRTTISGADQRRAEVVNVFKTTPFRTLCQEMNRSSTRSLQGALTEILAMVPLDSVEIPTKVEDQMALPKFETTFPDLFVY
ncbi:protein EFR3B-like, partial [Tropilaelaps mercedesae]